MLVLVEVDVLPSPKIQLYVIAPILVLVNTTACGVNPDVTSEVNDAVGTPLLTKTVLVAVQPVVGFVTLKV